MDNIRIHTPDECKLGQSLRGKHINSYNTPFSQMELECAIPVYGPDNSVSACMVAT